MTSETWGATLSAWEEIYENCELSFAGISRRYDIAYASVKGWLTGEVIPREKNIKKMEPIMEQLSKTKRIPCHPSYGYATPEQIERLKKPIAQWERDNIMEQIEKQTRLQGKID